MSRFLQGSSLNSATPVLYDHLLSRYDPERALYLAVPDAVRASIFEEVAGAVLIEDRVIRLFTFSLAQEVIVQWMPQTPS